MRRRLQRENQCKHFTWTSDLVSNVWVGTLRTFFPTSYEGWSPLWNIRKRVLPEQRGKSQTGLEWVHSPALLYFRHQKRLIWYHQRPLRLSSLRERCKAYRLSIRFLKVKKMGYLCFLDFSWSCLRQVTLSIVDLLARNLHWFSE